MDPLDHTIVEIKNFEVYIALARITEILLNKR